MNNFYKLKMLWSYLITLLYIDYYYNDNTLLALSRLRVPAISKTVKFNPMPQPMLQLEHHRSVLLLIVRKLSLLIINVMNCKSKIKIDVYFFS